MRNDLIGTKARRKDFKPVQALEAWYAVRSTFLLFRWGNHPYYFSGENRRRTSWCSTACSKVDFLTFPMWESPVWLLRRKSEKDELMIHCIGAAAKREGGMWGPSTSLAKVARGAGGDGGGDCGGGACADRNGKDWHGLRLWTPVTDRVGENEMPGNFLRESTFSRSSQGLKAWTFLDLCPRQAKVTKP